MTVRFPIDPVALPLTPSAFRTQINNLLTSYHATDTDFLAEIFQNSIDALEDRFALNPTSESPTIELTLDPDARKITIADNGPGIPDAILVDLARPNFGNKHGGRKRGHKGVGLAFAIWSSKSFRFATKRVGDRQLIAGKLDGGIDWVKGELDEYPKINDDPTFRPAFLETYEAGTVLEFGLSQENRADWLLSRLNKEGVGTLLRTATAVGFMDLPRSLRRELPTWVEKTKIRVKIGVGPPIDVPMRYLFPHEHFPKKSMDLVALARISIEKQDKLRGKMKVIYKSLDTPDVERFFQDPEDQVLLSLVRQQKVTAYGAFADASATLKEWNEALYESNRGQGRLRRIVRPGIHFATATMPVGEILDIDLAYGSGNKGRIWLVVQFANTQPDLGRKTFDRSIVEIGQRVAQSLTADWFVPNRKLLIPSKIPHGETEGEQAMSLEGVRKAAEEKPDLILRDVGVVKSPASEQDVVALFHTLVGAKYLKGYQVYSVYGSSEKYDGVVKYHLERQDDEIYPHDPLGLSPASFGKSGFVQFPASILEFKPKLSDLIDNFEDGTKAFEEITLVVAWTVGDGEAFGGASDYRLEDVDHGSREKQFYGETHVLHAASMNKRIHVMILENVVSIIAENLVAGLVATRM